MLLTAERVLVDGVPKSDVGVVIGADGRIASLGSLSRLGVPDVSLHGRLLAPGFVNAHSHAFQRLLRGRTQIAGPAADNFWTWRDAMYRVAARLDAESLRVVARFAYLEMLLAGVTSVGEFHYVHHQAGGQPYREPNTLGHAVLSAAREVGIRLCLLDTIYLRGDFDSSPSALQRRFCDGDVATALVRLRALEREVSAFADPRLSFGVAAHSVRALHIDDIVALKTAFPGQPFHLHVSEQRREVEGCVAAYGVGPVELLAKHAVLDPNTTVVHATHLREGEVARLSASGATVCVCPSTEADLGDGLCDVASLVASQVSLALGTDGQTLPSILAEAARLEMHERLRAERRNALAPAPGTSSALAALAAATSGGTRALGLLSGGRSVARLGAVGLLAGDAADMVSFELADPSLAGADDASLLSSLVFSSDTRAVRDVLVGGEFVVRDGRHPGYAEAALAFAEVARRFAAP